MSRNGLNGFGCDFLLLFTRVKLSVQKYGGKGRPSRSGAGRWSRKKWSLITVIWKFPEAEVSVQSILNGLRIVEGSAFIAAPSPA